MTSNIKKTEYIPKKWEDVSCPICSSTERKLHERYGNKLQYTYVKCLDCKNIYQSPRPKYDEDFLNAAYGNYHIFSENYEYKESKDNDFHAEIQEILEYDSSRESILDVGCAMGDFLYQAKKYYKSIYGIEIGKNMAEYASSHLGIKIYNEQFEKSSIQNKFSCIHMSHVIEHVPNPCEWIAKAKSMLAPDGVLVICVPNMCSFTRNVKLFLKRIGLRKGRWKSPYRTPDHLFEPTVEGMRYFIENNGFSMIKIYTYSRSDMISKGFFANLFYRVFKCGSNIRLYAKLKPKMEKKIFGE